MGLRILGLLCRILLPLESSRLVALFRWDCFWYFGFIWDQGFLGLFHIFLLVGFAGKWVFLWFQFIYILLSWDWLKVAFFKSFLLFSYAFPIWFVLVLHVGFGEKWVFLRFHYFAGGLVYGIGFVFVLVLIYLRVGFGGKWMFFFKVSIHLYSTC